MEHLDSALDPMALVDAYGVAFETIDRWCEGMRLLYPDKILTNRDFLLYAKNTGWEALRSVDLIDYAQMAVDYRDRLLIGEKELEPDFGLLYKATEYAMRRHNLSRANLLHRVDAKLLKMLFEEPTGVYTGEPTRGTMLWFTNQGFVKNVELTEHHYSVEVTSKGKWALFVHLFYA